jgi:hypothetical protein
MFREINPFGPSTSLIYCYTKRVLFIVIQKEPYYCLTKRVLFIVIQKEPYYCLTNHPLNLKVACKLTFESSSFLQTLNVLQTLNLNLNLNLNRNLNLKVASSIRLTNPEPESRTFYTSVGVSGIPKAASSIYQNHTLHFLQYFKCTKQNHTLHF